MPQFKIKYNPSIIALSLIIAYLIFLSACLNDSPRRIPPKAVKGVIDLSDWDFNKDGPVDLNGEYEFYWMQHLMPDDFSITTPSQNGDSSECPRIGLVMNWKARNFPGMDMSPTV